MVCAIANLFLIHLHPIVKLKVQGLEQRLEDRKLSLKLSDGAIAFLNFYGITIVKIIARDRFSRSFFLIFFVSD